MKNSKSLLVIVPLVILIGYLFFIRNTSNDNLNIYRPSIQNDCFNSKVSVDQKLDLTKVINSSELVKSGTFNANEFEKSNCVILTNVVKKDLLKLDKYKVNHVKGINNQNYQLSYQEMLSLLKANKDINKEIIDAISFFINDESTNNFVIDKTGILQNNAKLAGPTINDASGVYVASINLELVRNDIYEMKSNKKVLKETKYIFTGLTTTFIKEDE